MSTRWPVPTALPEVPPSLRVTVGPRRETSLKVPALSRAAQPQNEFHTLHNGSAEPQQGLLAITELRAIARREPEDACLTGMTRSLSRRLLGLSVSSSGVTLIQAQQTVRFRPARASRSKASRAIMPNVA